MPPAPTDAPTLPDDVVEALQAGRKIEAIRRLRELRGIDLREAKGAVEAFERAHEPPARPEPIADATPSSGRVIVALLLAIALAVAYWRGWRKKRMPLRGARRRRSPEPDRELPGRAPSERDPRLDGG